MVKRNQGWERRIEITEIRRSETKLRKQRTADKRQQKVYVQEMLSLIDRHAQRPFNMHIWTDRIAGNSVPLLDAVRQDQSEKRRTRSGSMNEFDESAKGSNLLTGLQSNPKSSRKGRTRSNSVNDSGRTVLPKVDEDGATSYPPMLLCRSHFFHGKCQDVKGKKGGCRYNHYLAPYKTLFDVLMTKHSRGNDVDDMLNGSAENAPYGQSDVLQAIEMIHYMQVTITDDKEDSFISEEIAKQLAAHEVKPASIVYAVVNDKLIFDRYQEGLLVGDRDFIAVLSVEGDVGHRRLSLDEQEHLGEAVVNLPGSILEHTLTFLPDTAVAVATQVCRTWHQEIGRSPNLWCQMLQRRNWPVHMEQSTSDGDNVEEPLRDTFRQAYIEHYTAVRDLKAIRSALHALDSRKLQTEKEMCYQDFSTRKYAPATLNMCVGVHVWAANRILVGYSHDCSIRLFECFPRDKDEKICRELISQSIDPYKNTKKRNCILVSMDVDQHFIGCLCQVHADNVDTEAWVLVVVGRDDFLQGQSSAALEAVGSTYDDSQLKVIDVGEAVLNFLLSSDVVDHRLLQLIDFLVTGGQVGEIEVLVSHSLAACGDGRFMVEVSISIPAPADEDLDIDMLLVDRKLVLFSASAGAIVWIGESSDVSKLMRPRHENMSLSHMRRNVAGRSRQCCHVVVSSPVSSDLLLGTIEPTGHVRPTLPIHFSDNVRQSILDDEWQLVLPTYRPVVVTASSVVAIDIVRRTGDDRMREHKSIISVYPLHADMKGHDDLYRTIVLEGNLEVVRLVNFKDHYTIALCREHHPCMREEGANEPADHEEEEDELETRKSLCAICIHLPSGTEIDRFDLLDDIGLDLSDIPIISAVHGSTIGVGYASKGVIITGDDVRSVCDRRVIVVDDFQQRSSQKKKKKKVPAKNYRKDGFMRGMSLRG